jgi:WhiB family redox-sensing transcriptional regulator
MAERGDHVGPVGFEFGEWRYESACKGPEVDPRWWFPDVESKQHSGKALAVCAACPVRVECLEYALALPEPHGIWGGLTASGRRMEVRRRARLIVTAV